MQTKNPMEELNEALKERGSKYATFPKPKNKMDYDAFYRFAEQHISKEDAQLIAKETKSAVKAYEVLANQVESKE